MSPCLHHCYHGPATAAAIWFQLQLAANWNKNLRTQNIESDNAENFCAAKIVSDI